jgi:nitrate/nitrite transporter NarK
VEKNLGMGNATSSNPLLENVRILIGGFIAFLFLNVLNSSYSTLLTLIKEEITLTYTMTGALMSAYFVGYTFGQIPWGVVADKIGSRKVMGASILGIAVSTILFSYANVFWHAAVARFFAGLLGAGVFVPGVRLISGWFPAEARGTALGILSIGGSIGLVISSWMAPYASLYLGWRVTIMIMGVIGVTSSVAIWLILRDKPDQISSPSLIKDMQELASSRAFWALAFVQMVRLGANYAFIAWLPLLLQEEYNLSLIAAGGAFSLFNLAGMLSNPVGGLFSDRLGERIVLALSFAIMGLSVFSFSLVRGGAPLFVLVIIIGWFINFVRSPSFAIIPKLYGVEKAGKVSGLQNTFASVGALLIPLLLGYLKDVTASYWTGWLALSGILLLVSGVNLLLRVDEKKKERGTELASTDYDTITNSNRLNIQTFCLD